MVRIPVNESERLQNMIIKTQFHQCSPLGCKIKHTMQNQTFKNERVFQNNAFISKFCWDRLLHVERKSLKTRLKRTRKIFSK